jgi:GNAT superfamily N-acetyltransferase
MAEFSIRPLIQEDRQWVQSFVDARWGSDMMIVHGSIFYISQLAGFAAFIEDTVVGLITYYLSNNGCEITSLDSLREGQGIGTELLEAVKAAARQAGCKRLFLCTTNDNIHALRFYQKRGFVLSALRINAVTEARKIKPQIPLLGDNGIPIRDEIELEMRLD